MKKTIIYSMAVLAMVGLGSCAEDAATDFMPTKGHYTLDQVSGSLDTDSRTSLDLDKSTGVAWSADDRIAVINTTTNVIYEYVLSDGADTYKGKFTPVSTAATFDNAADIKAVYPAAAATVAGGKISLALNTANATAFAENDIKVSTTEPTVTSGETSASVNFGFKQLGTWCRFVFDMTGNADYAKESIQSVTLTTTAAEKAISGTAAIDFTGEIPAMGAGTETSVTQTLTTALPLSEPVTVNFMLLPAITNADQLKITVVTDIHTFVFFATPTKDFATGSTLRFPITITRFTNAATKADFSYVATRNAAYYYYGKTNCLLLANNATTGTLNVQPYEGNELCEMQSTDPVAIITKAEKAELVWRETALTFDYALDGNNLSITNANGYGNAVVAIKDADDTILWSYHVWRPESDPTQTLAYSVTKSGTYNVMPMALGATKVVTLADDATTKTAGCGLYYQWGRKDPLGRLASLKGDATYVAVEGMAPGGRQHLNNLPLPSNNEDRYMIDFATKNPTKFISVQSGTYYDDWAAKPNPNLWANPKGYEYPTLAQVKKSIYDPCPKGYRVVPIDLWENFSTTDYPINVANTNTNNDWVGQENGRGYAFYYEGNQTDGGKTDFYPALGHRDRQKGTHKYLGASGYYWSSAPVAADGINCYFLSFGAASVGLRNSNRHAYAMPLRCVKEE